MKKTTLILRLMLMASFFIWVLPAQAEEYITDPSQLPKADAYKAVVKINTFAKNGQGNLNHLSSGSGAIIDPSGIILTNYHVVTMMDEFEEGEYGTAWQICLTETIGVELECYHTAKLIAKDKDKDLALLQMQNISALSSQNDDFSYLDLASTDSTSVNDEVIVLGYPGIGGDTITITKGIVSGKETKYDNNWLKTDAVISFGSSGGAAIDADGKIIGITTQAHSDHAGSLGYLINSNSIFDWVNNYKNVSPATNPLSESLEAMTIKQKALETSNTFTNDNFAINKPSDWEFIYTNEYIIRMHKSGDDDGGWISLAMMRWPHKTNFDEIIPFIKKTYFSMGVLTMLNINKTEDITINNNPGKKITLSAAGQTNSIYYFTSGDFLIALDYDHGLSGKDEEAVLSSIDSLIIKTPSQMPASLSSYTNSSPQFSVAADNDWKIITSDEKGAPLNFYNTKYPDAVISVQVLQIENELKSFTNAEYLEHLLNTADSFNIVGASLDLEIRTNANNANYKLNDQITNAIFTDFSYLKKSEGELLLRSADHFIKSGNKYIDISFNMFTADEDLYQEALASAQGIMQSLSLSTMPHSQATPKTNNDTPPEENTPGAEVWTPPAPSPTVGALANRLRGRILLQVEDNGEAWYVKPDNGRRLYMPDGTAAYDMMRSLGMGITNADLEKIPVGIESRFSERDSDGDGLGDKLEEGLKTNPYNADSDGDGHDDGTEILNGYNPLGTGSISYSNLGQELKGKILLQVESRGEAWYINPDDGKRYYMKNGDSAYQIMRYLSLGISNSDLGQIPETGL